MRNQLFNNQFILILLSAILMGISQHPLSLGFLAWFGMIPLIYVISNTNLKNALLYSFLWGFSYNIIVLFWLSQNIGTSKVSAFISMIIAVLILSLNPVIVTYIWTRIKKSGSCDTFIIPFIWVSVEFARSFGILGFPWTSLANTQIDYFYLIQNAEYVGIYGVSFWILLINTFLYYILFHRRTVKLYLSFIVIFIFPWILGMYYFSEVKETIIDDYKVSIIQPNIHLSDKRDFTKRFINIDNLIKKSKKCIKKGSQLIIWPESALPYDNLQNPKTMQYIIDSLLIDNDSYLLTGNVIYDKKGHYNSAVLINKTGIVDIYNKRLLVPVAEYVPLSDIFQKLKEFNFGQANFSKGEADVVFETYNQKFSSLICFESTFPHINRRHAKLGADYFVYLVNDGWYESAPEPQQHFKQSIYRAIENRKTVVRCANTGISSVIYPTGEVVERLDLNTSGEITTFIKKTNRSTFYTNYGNVFAIIMLIITGVLFIKTFFKNEKNN